MTKKAVKSYLEQIIAGAKTKPGYWEQRLGEEAQSALREICQHCKDKGISTRPFRDSFFKIFENEKVCSLTSWHEAYVRFLKGLQDGKKTK